MWIAMSNTLALMRGHDLRFFQEFNHRDFAWLLIGVVLTVIVFWVIRRRRRLF